LSERLEEFRLKLEQSPENLLFRYSYAQLLSVHNQTKEAIDQLIICLDSRSDWMMAIFLKAKLEISLGRKADAISSLEKTIELAKSQFHDDPLAEAQELLESLL